MKLVKLNKRFKAFKEYGHQWAFRFDGYDPKVVNQVERVFQDMHGSQYKWNKPQAWRACFGSPVKNGPRPYWISFTNEHDSTVVLLQVNQ